MVSCLDSLSQHKMHLQESLPEMPAAARQRLLGLKLPIADVLTLTDDMATAAYLTETLAAGAPAKQAANWVMGDLLGYCKVSVPVLPGSIQFGCSDHRIGPSFLDILIGSCVPSESAHVVGSPALLVQHCAHMHLLSNR